MRASKNRIGGTTLRAAAASVGQRRRGAIVLLSAVMTALAFHLLSGLSAKATAILKAYGAGALIAMAAETMIPEAFHNEPRYSGILTAGGFAILILVGELAG